MTRGILQIVWHPTCLHHDLSDRSFLCFSDITAYPKTSIEQDLPRQNVTDTSPATLWLCGASHPITLDGTAGRVCTSPFLWEILILILADGSIRGLFKRESPSVESGRRALEGHVSKPGHYGLVVLDDRQEEADSIVIETRLDIASSYCALQQKPGTGTGSEIFLLGMMY